MASPPLHRDTLIDTYASGCKPRQAWRIGTEHEKIGFCLDSLKPIPYDGERSIKSVLAMLASDEWQPVYEEGNIIALKNGAASITLEPGGQLELSGQPLATMHETCAEVGEHLRLLRGISHQLGIGFLGLGFQPKWPREDIPWMPKPRYHVMKHYMPQVGSLGLDMMLRTATVQANLDFESEADMARKMRIAYCLQPLVTALYAASPFADGKPSGFASYRAHCWSHTDPARTGAPAMIFDDDFGFERYTDWVLDAPMYFIMRDGRYIDCAGASFRQFMQGKLSALPHEFPTLDDWNLHNSTVFPDVRLRTYLEMRGADAGPWPWICSLPALWKGILYDPRSLDAAWHMVADWQYEEVVTLRQRVAIQGFATEFRDVTALELCGRMLDIARSGLLQLDVRNTDDENEVKFLRPLSEAIDRGQTQADVWLEAYHRRWNGNIDAIFREAMYS